MNEKLNELVSYSYDNVELYHNYYSERGFNSKSLRKTIFSEVPIIDKRVIIPEKALSSKYNKNDLIAYQTSGTTGVILKVFWNKSEFMYSNKFLWSFRKKNYSINPTSKIVKFHTGTTICSNPQFRPRIIQDNRALSLSKLYLDDKQLKEYICCINEFAPEWIESSPGIINLLYMYMKDNNIAFNKSIKYIEVSGEYLSSCYRKNFISYYCTNFANQYGSRETNAIAIECKNGHLHCLPNNYVEVVDENNKLLNYNQEGFAIITNLYNKAMPFIRYNLGDRISLINGNICNCGNNRPIIKIAACRTSDYVITADGRKIYCMIFINVIGIINYLYNDIIRQHKIVQNYYDKFTVHLSVGINCNRNIIISTFIKNAEEMLNIKAEWKFLFYDYLFPNDITGKMSYFENEMVNKT